MLGVAASRYKQSTQVQQCTQTQISAAILELLHHVDLCVHGTCVPSDQELQLNLVNTNRNQHPG